MAVADLNGDRKKELVAVSSSGRAQVWRWNGRRFVSLQRPSRLLAWNRYPGQALCSGDIDGDRKEEILLLQPLGHIEVELRAYGWRHGRWRLKLRCPIQADLMGADGVSHLLGVLREPRAGRFLAAISHNIESAHKTLLFYRIGSRRLERISVVEFEALMNVPSGPGIVDFNGDGAEDLVLVMGGEVFRVTQSQPAHVPLSLQSYAWSERKGQFVRDQETNRFPGALKRMIGAARVGHRAVLLGVDDGQIVLCEQARPAFRTRRTGIPLQGDPVACGDLLGDGNCEVVSLDRGALRVSPRVLHRRQ